MTEFGLLLTEKRRLLKKSVMLGTRILTVLYNHYDSNDTFLYRKSENIICKYKKNGGIGKAVILS